MGATIVAYSPTQFRLAAASMRTMLVCVAVPHLLLLLYWLIGGQLTDLLASPGLWVPGAIMLVVWLFFLAMPRLFDGWPQATRVHVFPLSFYKAENFPLYRPALRAVLYGFALAFTPLALVACVYHGALAHASQWTWLSALFACVVTVALIAVNYRQASHLDRVLVSPEGDSYRAGALAKMEKEESRILRYRYGILDWFLEGAIHVVLTAALVAMFNTSVGLNKVIDLYACIVTVAGGRTVEYYLPQIVGSKCANDQQYAIKWARAVKAMRLLFALLALYICSLTTL